MLAGVMIRSLGLLALFIVYVSSYTCENDRACRSVQNCNASCNNLTRLCQDNVVVSCSSECEPLTGKCVQCVSNAQCTLPTQPYCTKANVCAQCNEDFHCRSNSDCNATCVNGQCNPSGVVCGGKNPNCYIERGVCATDCDFTYDAICMQLTPETPRCGKEGTCVQCFDDIHCQSDDDCGATCENDVCVPSNNTSLNCRKQKLRCHPSGQCVQCFSSNDCGIGLKCSGYPNYKCIASSLTPCVDDSECGSDTECNQFCIEGVCRRPPNSSPLDCTKDGLRCSGMDDMCTECTSDDHCTNPYAPYCQVYSDEPGFLTCVQCITTRTCSRFSCGSECSNVTHTCIGGIGSCVDPLTCVNFEGSPVCIDTCTSDSSCTANPELSRCNVNTGVCVECLHDEECQDLLNDCSARCDTGKCIGSSNPVICPPGKFCNPLLLKSNTTQGISECTDCKRDGHCTNSDLPFCSKTAYTCVRCNSNAHCRTDANCNSFCSGGECFGASTVSNCTKSGTMCDLGSGLCIQCTSNSDCHSIDRSKPSCNKFGTCVECMWHEDCRTNSTCNSWCRSDGVCVNPSPALDCTQQGLSCSLQEGACVQCDYDIWCPGDGICDFDTNTCVECIYEEDCINSTNCNSACINNVCVSNSILDCTKTNQVCDHFGKYECVTCRSNRDCSDRAKPYCYAPVTYSVAMCVQCISDSDCRSDTDCSSTCDLASHTCVSDSIVNCANSTHPICNTHLGICEECFTDFDCPMEFPFCFSNTCHECRTKFSTNSEADCRDDFNCKAECIYDTTQKRNLCVTRTPLDCSLKDMRCNLFSGQCSECVADSDCSSTPSTPYCSPFGTCVECIGDVTCDSNISCSSTCLLDFTCSRGVDCTLNGGLCNFGVCYTPQLMPSDCAWSSWTQTECNCGVSTLTRTVLQRATNGGVQCDAGESRKSGKCENNCSEESGRVELSSASVLTYHVMLIFLGILALF